MQRFAPRGRRGAVLAAVVIGVAALSLLLPSVPTTDPWGWIVWGREVAGLSLNTAVGGSPAWKPLPVLFTTPYSLLGGAAPALWIVTARAAGLAALVLAFRLGSRLAGPAAGAIAAVALAASGDFVHELAHGYTEPMTVALLLGAVDRHLDGRRGHALGLLFLAALGRPEAFPFLLAYGAWAGWSRHRLWLLAAGLAAAVPALWLGGDWWGSGDPLHGEKAAGAVSRAGRTGGGALHLDALAPHLGPALLALAVFAGLAAWRRGDRVVLWLVGLAAAWSACVVVPVLAGSAASARFLAPVVGVVCVLAGVGAVAVVRSAPRARRAAVVALGLVAVALAIQRAPGVGDELRAAAANARIQDRVQDSAAELGEHPPACGAFLLPAGYGWSEGAIAWTLRLPLDHVGVLPLRRVNPRRFRGAIAFSRAHRAPVYFLPRALGADVTVIDPLDGAPASVGRQRLRVRSMGEEGGWRTYRIRGPGAPRCSGA